MRLPGWLRALSTGRVIINPVINVPPPTVIIQQSPAAPAQSTTGQGIWSRLWSTAKVVGPALVAIAALVISLATYVNQRSANEDAHQLYEATVISQERQEAEQVSFLQGRGLSPRQTFQYSDRTVAINNSSNTPIYTVAFGVDINLGAASIADTEHSLSVNLYLGSIPACSVGTVDMTTAIAEIIKERFKVRSVPPDKITFVVDRMTFSDRDDVPWEYLYGGSLQQISQGELLDFAFGSQYAPLSATYKPAASCS